MIIIGNPRIVSNGDFSRLETLITIDNKSEIVWFEVDKKYESYLCHERGDAFLIAVLNYAMRNRHDIVSEAPISEYLLYNIETYLISGLVDYNKNFYRPNIKADIATQELVSAGAVGTGISCGVDSLHAVASQTSLKFKKHNITHLTFNNVGSHGEGTKAQKLYAERVDRPRRFAEEYGFEFVLSNSNLMDVLLQNHFRSHTYSSVFAVYCLQKLFSVFYYASSGYKYHEFTLVDRSDRGPGSYELLSLPIFSIPKLRIYSEGENRSRLEKLRKVVQYEPSYKYLDVCLTSENNCNKCEKCIRTLLGIDILGALEKYDKVFDIAYYRKNRRWYLKKLVYYTKIGKHDYLEMYPYFKHEISALMKIDVMINLGARRIYNRLPNVCKKALKGIKNRIQRK